MSRTTTATVVLAVTIASVLMTSPRSAAAQAPSTCQGQPATIVGTSGGVSGTAGDDVIVVTGSASGVDAGAGDDLVCIDTTGPMFIKDGPGDDSIDASQSTGNTIANLGPGADRYLGSSGADDVTDLFGDLPENSLAMDAGGGSDTLIVDATPVTADLGDGDDDFQLIVPASELSSITQSSDIDLGTGQNTATFELGVKEGENDSSVNLDLKRHRVTVDGIRSALSGLRSENIFVSAHKVAMTGNRADNTFLANACHVTLRGGKGNDILYPLAGGDDGGQACQHRNGIRESGGPGDDVLRGLGGDDILIGGPGHDKAFGLAGTDTCRAEVTRTCER